MLYDVRQSTVLKKLTLKSRSNQLCWNPMEAFHFTLACEDSNLYTFDMRSLDLAVNMHQDHLGSRIDSRTQGYQNLVWQYFFQSKLTNSGILNDLFKNF